MTERIEQTDNETRKCLKELSEAHPKLFEKHFREWMEKDGIARSLQAKLRCDLIANFNTTQLGKQLISQNGPASNNGSSLKRLALSPLILALNTLVGEFLYAQNCHFSLSVFCAEVPYRNALPDFECSTSFRFTKLEIAQILEAISGSTKCEDLKKLIIRCYEENSDVSLLFCILKYFIEQINRLLRAKSQLKLNEKSMNSICSNCTHQSSALSVTADDISDPNNFAAYLNEKCESNEIRRQELTTYRLLNKYLMVLTKRVKEMVLQCERIYQNSNKPSAPDHKTRLFKSEAYSTNFQVVGEALDQVAKDLRKIKVSEYNDKDLFVLTKAIQGLSQQFDICGNKFEEFRKGSKNKRKTFANASTETEKKEKTYSEWIKEMRDSKNGRKFIDKIASSVQKALEKQKAQLQVEADVKLQHQAELLKIHYKQKYLDHLTRSMPKDKRAHAQSMSESIEKQLQQYEQRYTTLLDKLSEIENHSKNKTTIPIIMADAENKMKTKSPERKGKKSPEVGTKTNRKEVQYPDQDYFDQNVKKIISDVQVRLEELDIEGDLVESKFQEYLAHQKTQNSVEQEATQRILQAYVQESRKIMERYEQLRTVSEKYKDYFNLKPSSEKSPKKSVSRPNSNDSPKTPSKVSKPSSYSFKNAILEAKKSLNLDKHTVKINQTEESLITNEIKDSCKGLQNLQQETETKLENPSADESMSHSKSSEDYSLSKKFYTINDAKCREINDITMKVFKEDINDLPSTSNVSVKENEKVKSDSVECNVTGKPNIDNKKENDHVLHDSDPKQTSHKDKVPSVAVKQKALSPEMKQRSPTKEKLHGNMNKKGMKKAEMDQLLLACTKEMDRYNSASNESGSFIISSSKKALLQKSLEKMEKLFSPNQTNEGQKVLKDHQPKEEAATKFLHLDAKIKQNKENLYDIHLNASDRNKDDLTESSSSSQPEAVSSKVKALCASTVAKFKIKPSNKDHNLIHKLQQNMTKNVVEFCEKDSSCTFSSSTTTSNLSYDSDSHKFMSVHLSTLGASSRGINERSSSSEIWNNEKAKKK